MSDRCVNLRDWEAAAQPAASVIVRPARQRIRAQGEIGPESLWHPPPCKIGDRAILREAWSWCRWFEPDDSEFTYGVRYISDGALVPHRDQEHAHAIWDKHGEQPLSPAVMPAALARWRRPVVSVEAVEITAVSEETWIAAGAAPWHFGDPNTLPSDRVYEAWLSTYGPGSWSGWVWVITLEAGGIT